MVLDVIAQLEARRRTVMRRVARLRAGEWWHVGTQEEAEMRMLAELNEIDYEMLCIQAGMKPRENVR